jgi:hypothetical protein
VAQDKGENPRAENAGQQDPVTSGTSNRSSRRRDLLVQGPSQRAYRRDPPGLAVDTAAGENLEVSTADDNAAEEILKVSDASDIAAGETLQVSEPPDTGSMAATAVVPVPTPADDPVSSTDPSERTAPPEASVTSDILETLDVKTEAS